MKICSIEVIMGHIVLIRGKPLTAFKVERSIQIDAPASLVRETVADFNTWPSWSPWLLMEPDASVTYQGKPGELGHGYDWEGEKVGAGGMILTALDANRLESKLTFLKPWKSKADIAFSFKSIAENKTRVKWHMDSSLPFFMFFMVNKMKAFISSDYDRGLPMLKDQIELGSIASKITVEGVVDAPSSLYAGKTHKSSMTDIAQPMEAAFSEVYKAVRNADAQINGQPFSLYNEMDLVKQACTYTAAIPLYASVELGSGITVSERPACKALKVVHVGAYRHLGNAWSTGMGDMRHLKLKADKSNPPFEVYINDPQDTRDVDLITEIYMPVRG